MEIRIPLRAIRSTVMQSLEPSEVGGLIMLLAALVDDGELPADDCSLAQVSRLGPAWFEVPTGSQGSRGSRIKRAVESLGSLMGVFRPGRGGEEAEARSGPVKRKLATGPDLQGTLPFFPQVVSTGQTIDAEPVALEEPTISTAPDFGPSIASIDRSISSSSFSLSEWEKISARLKTELGPIPWGNWVQPCRVLSFHDGELVMGTSPECADWIRDEYLETFKQCFEAEGLTLETVSFVRQELPARKPATSASLPDEERLRRLMVDYARGTVPGIPDQKILIKILSAAPPGSIDQIEKLFVHRFQNGNRCRSWGWFLTVVKNHFSGMEAVR